MPAAAAGVAAFAAANAGAIAAASAAVTVASTAYSAYSQKKQADAEYDYQSAANKEQAKQVAAGYGDLSASEIDLQKQAADAAIQQDLERREQQGRVNVFSAASGTYGGSVDSMLFDADQTSARNIGTILDRKAAGLYSIKQQAEQARQGSISRQDTRAINSPSWLDVGLTTAKAAVGAAASYNQQTATTNQLKPASGIKGGV